MSERMRQDTIHMPAKKKLLPDDYRPTEDEPFMSERQRAYFQGQLCRATCSCRILEELLHTRRNGVFIHR